MLFVAALALSLSASSSSSSLSAPSLSLPPARPWSGASEALIVDDTHPFVTPAERSRFTTTASTQQTRAFLDRHAAASPLVRLETFGKTAEGRDLVVVIVSSGAGKKPKPVVFAQAGIHADEIDGKDAGLMLLRDIAVGDKRALVDDVDFVFVPIFNVDGHERTSTPHRAHQRGPDNKGQTTTSQHINLNRDYAKADSPEMQAMLPLLQRFDPAPTTLTVDEVRFDAPRFGPGADGRIRVTATITHATTTTKMPAGSIRIPADQPRRLLAAALLEPEGGDSFFANGFFAHVFAGGGNDIESWALSSWAEQQLKDDPALRAAFTKRLDDTAFANDPDARLQWFFDRSPWAARDVGVDPVKRER